MSASGAADRLLVLFAQAGLARLLERLRRGYEHGREPVQITLPEVSDEERRAIAALLGRKPGAGRSVRVPVAELEAVLDRAGLAPDLRTALERTGGALRDRAGERDARAAAWERVFRDAGCVAAGAGVASWLANLRADGLLRRLADGDPETASRLLAQALRVLRHLPGHGQTLSTLAASVLGDAHALDTARPVATLVKRALRRRGAPDAGAPEGERELWAAAGIVVGGAITSTVLVLNLPVEGDTPSAHAAREARKVGQPLWLTLRQLVQDEVRCALAGQRVYVCENPAVVAAAADRLGARSAPLLCTCGQPGAAVNHLLARLHADGAVIACRADFDWPGVRIAGALMARFDARAWHFDAAAYRAATVGAGAGAGAGAVGMALRGAPAATHWDPDLAIAMREVAIAVPEERLLDALLASLL